MATSEERSAARKNAQREWAISYYGRMRHRVGTRIDQAIAEGKTPKREDLDNYDEYRRKLALLAEMPSTEPALLPSRARYYKDKMAKAYGRLENRPGRFRGYDRARDLALVRKYLGLLGQPDPWWLDKFVQAHARAHESGAQAAMIKSRNRVTRGVATEADIARLSQYAKQQAAKS